MSERSIGKKYVLGQGGDREINKDIPSKFFFKA